MRRRIFHAHWAINSPPCQRRIFDNRADSRPKFQTQFKQRACCATPFRAHDKLFFLSSYFSYAKFGIFCSYSAVPFSRSVSKLNDGRYLNPPVQYLPFSCVKPRFYAVFYNQAFPFVQICLFKTLKSFIKTPIMPLSNSPCSVVPI